PAGSAGPQPVEPVGDRRKEIDKPGGEENRHQEDGVSAPRPLAAVGGHAMPYPADSVGEHQRNQEPTRWRDKVSGEIGPKLPYQHFPVMSYQSINDDRRLIEKEVGGHDRPDPAPRSPGCR